jgi:mersacidin/lichenicidin family type 2 lantibiotic
LLVLGQIVKTTARPVAIDLCCQLPLVVCQPGKARGGPSQNPKGTVMSTEEIIHAWKNELQSDKKSGRAAQEPEVLETEPGKAPANPAGEQELSDEELALIEGGEGSTLYNCTTKAGGCPPTRPL